MRERPVSDLVDAMRELGAGVDYAVEEGRFPLLVRGGGMAGGEATVRVGKSSQFLSGLLMAAPYAASPVTLELCGELVSRPYVGITTGVMREFGVEVSEETGRYRVSPAAYSARDYYVEPDASAASYFFAAAALTGGGITVPGLGEDCSQGDLRFVEVLEKMGCGVKIGPDSTAVRGPERLRGVNADMNEISDTFITLAAIAPFASTPTTITGIAHTRHQETDRVHAVATELRRLGVQAEEQKDSLRIIPPRRISPATIRTYEDHRIAMGFALTGLVEEGVRISDPGCVAKTFPDYFERLSALRGSPE